MTDMTELTSQIAIRILCQETDAEHHINPLANQLAIQLAKKLNLVLLDKQDIDKQHYHFPFYLEVTDSRLQLRDNTHPKFTPLYVDFLSGKLQHRQRFGGGRGELIAKAIGIKSVKKNDPALTVLDLTAGLGEDSFILANLGCYVTMIERHPIVACLLRDGLSRLKINFSEQNQKLPFYLELIEAEASLYLSQLETENYPSVIYLDPMFPHRDKSALVKKEMQILQKLVGPDNDADRLLDLALHYAKKRVVVKRPRLAPFLMNKSPQLQIIGKSCRFDVYITHQEKSNQVNL
jgi:16S rRNA (guanine1516-N2)-methyltransferase